jgi:hypothetical protein
MMGIEIDPGERCETAAEGAALGLLGLMSGISEEHWCAGWLTDLEFRLWDAQAGKYGQGVITERQVKLLRLLSEECEGWWHWKEDAENPEFISLAEWRDIVAKRKDPPPPA